MTRFSTHWLLPLVATVLMACPSTSGNTGGGSGGGAGGGAGGGSTMGNGSIKDLTPSATAGTTFRLPLDAALSPDGKTAYFIALNDVGDATLFKANAPSTEAPTVVHTGVPLAAPFGLDVSSNGMTLIVSDTGVEDAATGDRGVLFTVSANGGTPEPINGTAGYQPKGLVVVVEANTDQIYFSGKDTTDGAPGVFKVAVTGGTVTAVAKGGPFVDPSGLAVTSTGTVFVADVSGSAPNVASIIQVTGGTPTTLLPDIKVGYPAGVALSQDEKVLLVSALDAATGTDIVIRYDLAAKSREDVSMGISQFTESAGLKRARNVDTFIWADSAANNGGTVFVINKQQ